ncbi:MAG TPA: histidine phosphatase family protein [Candidatus Saccharimonadales bacterium]|nr:histidine phosphatase family protein [Candidatus Saccharimonadales bacterium]
MSILVIRHGLSEANNRDNYGTPAFGNPEAPLMPMGRKQAAALGKLLVKDFGVDLANEPVAVSTMRRTQETAIAAGFTGLHLYPELNEEKGNMTDAETRAALQTRQPPEATLAAARLLIEHPPVEKIWITHALLIATICQELGVYQNERFTPKFCEVRELPL